MRLLPIGLWLLVAVQVAIPASYYWLRDDRDDERFAWRMFSTVRLQRCAVHGAEVGRDGVTREVDLQHTLHASWIRSLERGRAHVIERFLSQRCERDQVSQSELSRLCQDAAGRPLPSVQYRYDCASGALEAIP